MSEYPFIVKEHVVPGQHIREYAHATANAQEEVLHLAVKQYIPRNNQHPKPGDLTIVAAHANGLPKELYEPLWEELLSRTTAAGIAIRSIWMADVAHQGASGALNEEKLGGEPSWHDHSRDLAQLINHFRKQMPRPLVGIGHSMGAAALVSLAAWHPRLLTSLVLIEPTILAHVPYPSIFPAASGSARRRDVWPDRAAAEASFRRSPFYGAWDERVLRRWLDVGLRNVDGDSDGQVRLATTKDQEVLTYLRRLPAADEPAPADFTKAGVVDGTAFYRAEPGQIYSMLPHLRPRTQFIFGAKSEYSLPDMRAAKMRTTGVGSGGSRAGAAADSGAVADVCFEGRGHMVCFEAVGDTADVCAAWLADGMSVWREAEEREARDWSGKSSLEKRSMDQGYKDRLAEGVKKNTPARKDRGKL